ncbi:hypothetical protein PQU92_08745 [Asticcacaulis sp. BYS171W]|uniref:Uncharacterized protein n=1 Tax=Asticcacaulis aquaticus TaxID=2984212 RepID=A0ABT5HTW5_9CAUL|nr:hypothetical protein [Asticcacaulis aquaticus]MDC7683362.1 hypothetical protein [Asticcacaulis aquaticus]
MTDTYTPLHDRLMIQAQRMLAEIERAKPSTLKEVVAVLSALCVATRLIRQLHTPLTKARSSSPVAERTGEVAAQPTEGAKPLAPSPLSQRRMEEVESPEEKAEKQTLPVADSKAWQKGWSDKQAVLREQRAARTGKWPDGTPYRKTG